MTGHVAAATAITPAAAWYEREVHERFGIDIRWSSRPAAPDSSPAGLSIPEGRRRRCLRGGGRPGARRHHRARPLPLQRGRRHRAAPRIAPFLHPQGYGEAVGRHADHEWPDAGRVGVGRQLLRPCGRVLPGSGECVSESPCRRVHAPFASSDWNWSACLPTSPMSARCAATSASPSRLPTTRASRNRCCKPRHAWWARASGRASAFPGACARDLSDQSAAELGGIVGDAARDFAEMAQIILDTPSVQNRFESTGVLKPEVVRDLAVVGPVARASGVEADVRRDHPYGRYREIALEIPHFSYGDVMARARIRIEETRVSAALIQQTLRALPPGNVCAVASATGQRRRPVSGGVAARGAALLGSRARRPDRALPHQVSVVPELAGAAARHARQHHCRLPADQ